MTLVITPLSNLPLVTPGANLARLIIDALEAEQIVLQNGDIFVLAQKIVSKAENRFINLAKVEPSAEAIELAQQVEKDPRMIDLVLRESRKVLRHRPGTIIVEHRLGFICANAGIDHSNVREAVQGEEWVLLLPENPDASAEKLRKHLEERYRVRLGILIIDSHGRAWRMGTTGVTIGLSGVPGLVDLRGRSDLFGYTLQITQVGAADELASAASLVMGQAAEGTPLVHVRGFPYPLRESELNELIRPEELDLFR
ncbi:MAG: coenzyme F420-0:L-glutamate ligase [Chloroflexota bacterium]|nr:MAG: coenzyme F420-0:L-glutamate ligase [Chloroflexota bacterium]